MLQLNRQNLLGVNVLAGFEQLFDHQIVRRWRGEIDDNFNRLIRQNFSQGQNFDAVFLRRRGRFRRISIAAAHHIENLKLIDHRVQIGVADHAAADNRRFYGLNFHRLDFLVMRRLIA